MCSLIVAAVVATLLIAVSWVVRRVEVQKEARRRAAPAALSDVELDQGPGDAQAVLRTRSVLQTREGGLARQVRPPLG